MKKFFGVVLFLIISAAALVVIFQFWNKEEVVISAVDRIIAEKVGIRTLTEEITVTGLMRRDEIQTLNASTDGRISKVVVADGDTVEPGETLFLIEGRPIIAVAGAFPFYRELDVGSQGPDVYQLESFLFEAGYEVGNVDTIYTEKTRKGLGSWQINQGYSGVTSELEEVVSVSLLANPAGYRVGAANTASVTIGPSIPKSPISASRQGTISIVDSVISTVTISTTPAVVVEGGKIAVTLTADPIPTTDLEIGLKIDGDVTVDDDFVDIDEAVVIVAGTPSTTVELITIVDDDLEPNETLEVTIFGGFENISSTASQTLNIYDLEVEIDKYKERRFELSDDISETKGDLEEYENEISALESLQKQRTDVEDDLVKRRIISSEESLIADVTAVEADNLITLREALKDADSDLALENMTVASHGLVRDSYFDALDDALEESQELVEARDEFEATEILLEKLLDEQNRLDYLIEVAVENLRITNETRWVVGDPSKSEVVIDDPEVPDVPVLVLRALSESVNEPGNAGFTVETTTEMVEDIEIYFETSGTAVPDKDFNIPTGDITMSVGTDAATINIVVRDDDLVEVDETLTVRLLEDVRGSYALSEMSQATTKIVSPDLPELSLTGGGRVAEGETGYITITADQAPKQDTSVTYSVSGSAQSGIDYKVVTGSALLLAGQTQIDIPIRTIRDDVLFLPSDMMVGDWPARVGKVQIDSGDFVQRGSPMVTLTEPSFTITLTVSPTDRAKLEVGQEVSVKLDAGDQESLGVISQLDDSATTQGGSERYEGVVEVFDQINAVEGAVVGIDVVVNSSTDAIVVPIAAVLTDGPRDLVRVVNADGVIERRNVEIGMLDGAWVEIVSGLFPGELVVLEIERS